MSSHVAFEVGRSVARSSIAAEQPLENLDESHSNLAA